MGKYIIKISKSAEKDLSLMKRSGKKVDIDKINQNIIFVCYLPDDGKRKKSRRNADRFSRAFEAVALIFRAAASFCLLLNQQ